ncbi:hypothetical protein M378DRAFT_919377 [Amanita muscaria Koide BX008]|uniref:Uncharacterized protein n=1 Tax=Amanita muscaria (strain Koide BX008) TaxID=946122 RepID=A0A0C2SBY5_AMAMK|nr:hypothetical protein M378DRAFT_919377 [Amanita muscaria Koide BX008]
MSASICSVSPTPTRNRVNIPPTPKRPFASSQRLIQGSFPPSMLETLFPCKYECSSGRFQSAEPGRVTSHCYYVGDNLMMMYNQHSGPTIPPLRENSTLMTVITTCGLHIPASAWQLLGILIDSRLVHRLVHDFLKPP